MRSLSDAAVSSAFDATGAAPDAPLREEARGRSSNYWPQGSSVCEKHLNTQIHQITRTSPRHHSELHCPSSGLLLAAGMATEK